MGVLKYDVFIKRAIVDLDTIMQHGLSDLAQEGDLLTEEVRHCMKRLTTADRIW